ncbi:hypothetical protein ACLQ3F_30210 [Micromonospora sp. DT15]|uniref:hypothetical protein n=1 Tax=Micromonospora sp. DT15 TaxID=3393445 RepID=UPI003CE90949
MELNRLRHRLVPVALAAAAVAGAAARFLPIGVALLLAATAVLITLVGQRHTTSPAAGTPRSTAAEHVS